MNFNDWLALITLSALLAGCAPKKEPEAKDAKEAKPEATAAVESRVKHGTNGEVTVTLESQLQASIGLRIAVLQPVQLTPELKAYGRVLDPSPLATLVADWVTAEAAYQASQAEWTRVKALAVQSNASERAVQTAQAAAVRDQAQVQATMLRIMASWGSAISRRTDLPEFVQSLVSMSRAVVQLEVPAGQALADMPTGARLVGLANRTNVVSAEWLGPAPSVDPQMQGRGFLFLVSPSSAAFAPGAAVTGWLDLPGEQRKGVMLPREAVIWFNGASWVYLKVAEESFQRLEVALDSPMEAGWFVATGLKAQDRVVTVAGQQLLSEELKGQIEGD